VHNGNVVYPVSNILSLRMNAVNVAKQMTLYSEVRLLSMNNSYVFFFQTVVKVLSCWTW
jgi:hypothetical protein